MRFYEKLVEILNVELLREKKQKQNNFQLIEFQQENWSHWQVITAAEGIEIWIRIQIIGQFERICVRVLIRNIIQDADG